MGAVASRLADEVVITTDNPRHEDPLAIIADITRGVRSRTTTIEPDRTRAIRMALDRACRGDVVLIAGKGHERYQEIGGIKRPYSDAAVAARELGKIRGGARCP
jgi:UDP-N-acetylmuramyl tripeptide synthase